ncbi:MAG: four helix bundle protein [Dehalococcoidia bacterium]
MDLKTEKLMNLETEELMDLKTEEPKNGKTDIFRFREFPVYKETRAFRLGLKALSKNKFPKAEQFCLTSQLWRALDSILLNIAEGTERYSDIDFSRFLNTALTSLNEVVACLDAALDDRYITRDEHQLYIDKAENIYRQLRAFSAKVRRDGGNVKTYERKN